VLVPGVDLDDATDHLLGWYDGVATHATLEPDRYPPERQRALIDYARCVTASYPDPAVAPSRRN
jgi:hypothetical protein